MTTCSYSQAKHPNVINVNELFLHPPESAKPWVFWYWMQASVSKAGITADLEAMKQVGIGGAYLMTIKGPANPPLTDAPIVQLTPEWWKMVKFAMAEARRLGLKLAMHVSDGFALAGGPWITPDLSMQKVVWTERQVKGSIHFNDILEQPETNEGYYNDIAVYAYPSAAGAGLSTKTIIPIVSCSNRDSTVQSLVRPDNKKNFSCEDHCWVQYAFKEPFTCRSIIIHSKNNYQSNRLLVEISNDGINFTTLGRLDPPRSGWQDGDADYTHSIPSTTAKYFRFTYDKAGSEPGAEDLDAAKWKPSFKLTGIELSSEPRISQFEGKNGEVWRIAKATTKDQIPDHLCIQPNTVIDLTNKIDKQGRLNWNVPAGDWTIVRIGHTSTGHKNDTGGGGKGLECDKFNPVAVRTQFDSWFGEVFKQVGPDANEVLKIFHVDSWECGSQNWSPVFREEFIKRRGYDPIPYLIIMAGVPMVNADFSEKYLHDIRETIADLIADNFYVTLAKLAHAKGCRFTAESVAPTMVSDGMLHYKYADIPMGEFWLRSPTHDKPNDMADAISGGHIYGRNVIQAEGFTELRTMWDEQPGMMKPLLDRNFVLGINRMVFHVFMHNPWMDRKPGMTLDGIGLFFQRDQTWWNEAKAFIAYTTRCQALLQIGKPVTDIAVFTGEDYPRRAVLPDRLVQVFPGFFSEKQKEEEHKRLQNNGEPLMQSPVGVTHSANLADYRNFLDPLAGYAYDSFNPDVLRQASVKNGRIELPGGASYGVLVIPGSDKMNPNGGSLNKQDSIYLKNLIKYGAKVISGTYRDSSFKQFNLQPDVIATVGGNRKAEGIAWTHRRAPGIDIYFISNQDSIHKDLEISLRDHHKFPVTFDPVDGEINAIKNPAEVDGRIRFSVSLPPNGSVFVVFHDNKGIVTPLKSRMPEPPIFNHQISTPWMVTFDPKAGGPSLPVTFPALSDWSSNTDSSIRYYSGTAIYSNSFNWSKNHGSSQVLISVGKVDNIAEVFVNGIKCGTGWTPPFTVNITNALKQGNNELKIMVTNTWANRIIGDQRLPESRRITKTNAPYRLDGKPLLEAGLIGPVKIGIVR